MLHALVIELELVAHAAVEHRAGGAAGFRAERIGGAGHAQQRAGHRIQNPAAVRLGDGDAVGIDRRLRVDGKFLDIA